MRRTTDKLAVTLAALSFLCMVVVTARSWTVLDTSQRLEEASLGVCGRLQKQRERENLSDARQFLILRQVLRSPRLTERARREYRQYVDSAEYGPPTDCMRAVDDPPHYDAPPFIAFSAMGARGPVFAKALLDAAERRQPPPVYRP